MLQPMFVPERRRGLSRLEYERIFEAGTSDREPFELLRGRVVPVMSQGPRHGRLVAWLGRELTLALGREYIVRPQMPFAATDDSEPEPDLAVTRDERGDQHPSVAMLVIEVADSSLVRDRDEKLPIYAEAGVPEYWIIDAKTATVTVMTEPAESTYLRVERLGPGDVLRPTRLPGVELPVAALPWSG
jgi:Uma2 family endonuclease